MTGSNEMKPLGATELKELEPDAIRRLDHVVYGVTNGRDVLQLGKGSGARAAKCMRGSLAAKHNKAFICAVYETITGVENRYFALECASRAEAADREAVLHRRFGITTNEDAACVLSDRLGPLTIEQVHTHVVDRLCWLSPAWATRFSEAFPTRVQLPPPRDARLSCPTLMQSVHV